MRTRWLDINWVARSMQSQNNRTAVVLGITSAIFTPAIIFMAAYGIIGMWSKNAGPLAPGPTCKFFHRVDRASLDGRFIASLLSIACEDDINWPTGHDYIFIASTRLDKAAHVMTLSRDANTFPSIFWDKKNLVIVEGQNKTIEYSKSWCGITSLFLASSPRR